MIIYRDNQPPLLSDYGIEIPMLKGRAERVKEELEKTFGPSIFITSPSTELSDTDFLRVHTKEYLDKTLQKPEAVCHETFELINPDGSFHRYDPKKAIKPLKDLVPLFKQSCADTYLCLVKAYEKGFSYYLGGGFHHALSNRGRGFCMFNDILIAAKKFQAQITAGRIWVLDLDVHKGCGTAAISEQDETILTFSIHMKHGWPLDSQTHDESGKLNPWFISSTVDVELERGQEDQYISSLQEGLNRLAFKSKENPALCIVVDGSDPYEYDVLPSAAEIKLTKDQCLERNLVVYDFLKKRNIPQAYLMSGGYGEKNWIIHYQFLKNILSS